MIRRPPRSTQSRSSAASDVYKRQALDCHPDIMDKVYKAHHRFGNLLHDDNCLLYTSPSPRDGLLSRMPSSA